VGGVREGGLSISWGETRPHCGVRKSEIGGAKICLSKVMRPSREGLPPRELSFYFPLGSAKVLAKLVMGLKLHAV